jgi:CBS domain-containing protein
MLSLLHDEKGVNKMKVSEFLKTRSRPVITIGPDDTVHAAIEKLVANNIGALPACDAKGMMVGIISERDILRHCAHGGLEVKNTKVKDVMTKDVAVGVPGDDLDYVMNTMRQKEIRHLPIMDGAKPVSMISARDVIEAKLEACQVDVRHLNEYISGGYV